MAARDIAVDIGDGAGARGERADYGAALALVERVQRRLGGVTHNADKAQTLGMLDLGLDGGGKAFAYAELGGGEVPAHLVGDKRLGHLHGGLRIAQAAASHKQRDERQGTIGGRGAGRGDAIAGVAVDAVVESIGAQRLAHGVGSLTAIVLCHHGTSHLAATEVGDQTSGDVLGRLGDIGE